MSTFEWPTKPAQLSLDNIIFQEQQKVKKNQGVRWNEMNKKN